ncbi:MAG: CvpA family protein [Flavobacteriia bacterium]|nr:MAG: CvpA family protein [Flavobacteriia bacterium]
MNTLDIILALILSFGFIRGFLKGFIVEVTSLAALVLGIYGAVYFSYILSDYIKTYSDWDPSVLQLVSFAGTFLIIVILISLAGKLITKLAENIALGVLNKFLGGIFGLLKVGMILSIVLLVFSKLNDSMPFVEKIKVEDSILYEPVKNFSVTIFPNLIKDKKNHNK